MARRRGRDPELTLFPFLSVLAVVMGTLVLIISGMSQLALANPRQRVEVDQFDPGKKTAIYVECRADGLVVYPDDPTTGAPTFVPLSEIESPTSAWGALVRRVEIHAASQYLLLLVRPEGVASFQLARNMVNPRAVELGYEPVFGTGAVRFQRKAP